MANRWEMPENRPMGRASILAAVCVACLSLVCKPQEVGPTGSESGNEERVKATEVQKDDRDLIRADRDARRGFELSQARRWEEAIDAYRSALEGGEVDRRQLRLLRIAMHDARNVVLLGDPAVRTPAARPGRTVSE